MIPTEILQKAKSWLSDKYDNETRERVNYLIENDEKELIDSFYTSLEFGTGGLRGIMGPGTNRMNIYTVGMATQGLCNYLIKNFGHKPISVAIAYDSRNNSELFANKVAEIFSANNIKAYLFDSLKPTPELSFAIRLLKCQSGIVVTASHNPKEYNGYKVYWEDGAQVIEPHDKNIINEVNKITDISEVKTLRNDKLIEVLGENIDKIYINELKKLSLNPDINVKQKDIKIVYTPIHGTGTKLVPETLKAYGFNNINIVEEQSVPDGNFPTVKSPNPEEAEALTLALKKAKEIDADVVMATDPDADRVGIAVKDNQGNFILLNGNQTASVLINYIVSQWSKKGKLNGKQYIVKTIVTTELLKNIADKYNVKYYDVLTGFKYIADIIGKNEGKTEFIGGGEESYGYLFGEFVRDKDAVMSCALIAELAAYLKENNSNIYNYLIDTYIEYGLYVESLISITKKGKDGAEEIKAMMENYRNNPPCCINKVKVSNIIDYNLSEKTGLPKSNVLQLFLEDGSKITIRPSGTEPKIKFYFGIKGILNSKDEFISAEKNIRDRINEIIADMDLK